MDRTETIKRFLANEQALRQLLEANLAHHHRVLAIRAQLDELRGRVNVASDQITV